jgi:hypothetical protein
LRILLEVAPFTFSAAPRISSANHTHTHTHIHTHTLTGLLVV